MQLKIPNKVMIKFFIVYFFDLYSSVSKAKLTPQQTQRCQCVGLMANSSGEATFHQGEQPLCGGLKTQKKQADRLAFLYCVSYSLLLFEIFVVFDTALHVVEFILERCAHSLDSLVGWDIFIAIRTLVGLLKVGNLPIDLS